VLAVDGSLDCTLAKLSSLFAAFDKLLISCLKCATFSWSSAFSVTYLNKKNGDQIDLLSIKRFMPHPCPTLCSPLLVAGLEEFYYQQT